MLYVFSTNRVKVVTSILKTTNKKRQREYTIDKGLFVRTPGGAGAVLEKNSSNSSIF